MLAVKKNYCTFSRVLSWFVLAAPLDFPQRGKSSLGENFRSPRYFVLRSKTAGDPARSNFQRAARLKPSHPLTRCYDKFKVYGFCWSAH